jgi:hypothetical protein
MPGRVTDTAGWKSNSNNDHPLDVARAKLEAIAPLATRNPISAAAEEGEEQLSDAALLRKSHGSYLRYQSGCGRPLNHN